MLLIALVIGVTGLLTVKALGLRTVTVDAEEGVGEYGVGASAFGPFPGTHRHGHRSCLEHFVLRDSDDEAGVWAKCHQAGRCLSVGFLEFGYTCFCRLAI